MALINCNECGNQISDKATNCVHCGCPIFLEKEVAEKIICNECGNQINKDDKICKNCGCPLEPSVEAELLEENSINQVHDDTNTDVVDQTNLEVKDNDVKNKHNFLTKVWIIVLLIFIAITTIGFISSNSLENTLTSDPFKYEYYSDGTTITETYYFYWDGTGSLETHFDFPQIFNSYDRHYSEKVKYTIENNNTVIIISKVATTRYKYNTFTKCLVSEENSNIKLCKY